MMSERLELLRLVLVSERRPLILFVLVGIVTVGAPVATSLLTGALTRQLRASGDVGATVWAGVGVAVSIVVLQQAMAFHGPLVARVTSSIDGHLRRRVRFLASEVLPFAIVESDEFQTDASRVCDPGAVSWRSRTPGAAAIGQLWLIFRILAALALGVVIATFNVVVAVVALAGAFAIRAIVRGEWVPYFRIVDDNAPLGREADDIAATFAEPRFAREFAVFGFGPWLIEQWHGRHVAAKEAGYRALVKIAQEQWLTGIIAFVLAVVSFGLLGLDAAAGRLSAPELAVAMVAVTGAMGMSTMGWEAWDIDYGLSAMRAYRRIESLSASHPAPQALTFDAPAAHRSAPEVVLERVAFGYRDRPVLQSVSLTLIPGERLAIVGRNGAGKSTLTKLISGLYAPQAGDIRFDGVSATDPESGGSSVVAIMNQDALRLPLDVRMNVTLGATASDDEVWEALTLAGLADGLRQRGITLSTALWNTTGPTTDLSGGQWQRLTLARAILAAWRGKRILILDEPTSQFDVRGETEFYNTVMAGLPGVTVVLITHRLSTVRRADRIALLEDGRIGEIGSHDELMRSGGAYAAMFRAQADRFREIG
ncbi:ABC transporter ATP-binding protein [Tessaracoccus sp. HF-7]|nr:ABC transporter ATP-binding protein [Tessaracoccus caeni]